MTKSVSKIVVVVVAIAALLSLSGVASAQYAPTDPAPTPVEVRGSTFEPDPETARTGFLGFASLSPEATGIVDSTDTTADITSGGTGGGLAITGVETNIALALGVGLLAVGGTAVVASRKRTTEE